MVHSFTCVRLPDARHPPPVAAAAEPPTEARLISLERARDKVAHLEAFLDDFELLKLEIRLLADLKILSLRKQAHLVELTDTIGRQITPVA